MPQRACGCAARSRAPPRGRERRSPTRRRGAPSSRRTAVGDERLAGLRRARSRLLAARREREAAPQACPRARALRELPISVLHAGSERSGALLKREQQHELHRSDPIEEEDLAHLDRAPLRVRETRGELDRLRACPSRAPGCSRRAGPLVSANGPSVTRICRPGLSRPRGNGPPRCAVSNCTPSRTRGGPELHHLAPHGGVGDETRARGGTLRMNGRPFSESSNT